MNIKNLYIILLISIISSVFSFDFEESKECYNERMNIDYIKKCFPYSRVNLSNYKEHCLNIKSEKCQAFYEESDPSQHFPICSQFNDFKEMFKPGIFQTIANDLQTYCQTDENDELCPLSLFKLTLTDKTTSSSTLLNDTCHSKKCTDSFLEFLSKKTVDNYAALESSEYFNKTFSYDDLVSVKKVKSELESDKCKAMHVTSNAFTINTNNMIMLLLSLVLILLY